MIHLDKWLYVTGTPKTTFRGWKKKLVKGQHYFVNGRSTYVDSREMDKWLRASGAGETSGSYEPPLTAKRTPSRSTTPILKLV